MEYIPKQQVQLKEIINKVEKLQADLDYIAMMSDIELEEEDTEDVEEVPEG